MGGAALLSDSGLAPGSWAGLGGVTGDWTLEREVRVETLSFHCLGLDWPTRTRGGRGRRTFSPLTRLPGSCSTFPAVPRGAAATCLFLAGGGSSARSRRPFPPQLVPAGRTAGRPPRDPAFLQKNLGMLARDPGPKMVWCASAPCCGA